MNMILKYNQKQLKTICTVVSNNFPFHSKGEYPKNCTNSLINQNIPIPSEMVLPSGVSTKADDEVRQSNPMRKTASAMKKV
jgi:hypothetical protein